MKSITILSDTRMLPINLNTNGSDIIADVTDDASMFDNVTATVWAQTEEYIPVYDYFDINDRITWMLNTPQQVFPLVVGSVALAANLVCVAAVLQVRERWTNLYHFMLSLMLSDILVAASVMAHIINWVVNPLYHSGYGPWHERVKSRCFFIVIKNLNVMGLNVTLLNLMTMATDHYIAILWPLHYGSTLNKRRSRIIILLVWLVAFVTAFAGLASPLWDRTVRKRSTLKYNYCELVWLSPFQEEYSTFIIAGICCCVMVTMYVRIYWAIRRKHGNGAGFETRDGRIRDKSEHNTRALLTTLLILGSFALCWLPMCFFQIIMLIIMHARPELLSRRAISTLTTVDQYLYAMFLINTLCDPIIYAIRIRDVRHGVLLILARFLPRRLRNKAMRRSCSTGREVALPNTSSYSISLLSQRRGTEVSSLDDGGAGDDKDIRRQQLIN